MARPLEDFNRDYILTEVLRMLEFINIVEVPPDADWEKIKTICDQIGATAVREGDLPEPAKRQSWYARLPQWGPLKLVHILRRTDRTVKLQYDNEVLYYALEDVEFIEPVYDTSPFLKNGNLEMYGREILLEVCDDGLRYTIGGEVPEHG